MIYKKTHSGLNGLKIEIYSFDLKGKLLPFRISCIMLILENLKFMLKIVLNSLVYLRTDLTQKEH